MSVRAAATWEWERCRLCKARLKAAAGDDTGLGCCATCKGRPEAARLRVATNGRPPATSGAAPRSFSGAEGSLIQAMHGYLPVAELLRILNERMAADLGAGAVPYTHEDLHREIAVLGLTRQDDWTALRQLLAQARAIGLLEWLTPGVLEDFAVVFQLSPGQVTHLRDVVTHAQEPTP